MPSKIKFISEKPNIFNLQEYSWLHIWVEGTKDSESLGIHASRHGSDIAHTIFVICSDGEIIPNKENLIKLGLSLRE
jgi:hypothetical protein